MTCKAHGPLLARGSALLLVFVAVALPASAAAQDKGAAVDALIEGYHLRGEFNGSALVAEAGRVILQDGYGMANFEWGVPNAADTKHRLGSITKQFTAMLILQLAADGALSLDAPVSDLLPWYRQDTGARMTVHHLLTHTSGLPNYTNAEFFRSDAVRRYSGLQEFIEQYCSEDLEFDPGERWNYSNSAYMVLGAIVEAVGDKSYEELLAERIYLPAGMLDSGYDRGDEVIARRAAGYERADDGTLANAPYIDMSVPHAAGALYSTVQDLYRWDRALHGETLLSEEWKEKLFAPHAEVKDPDGNVVGHYGYGWALGEYSAGEESWPLVRHGGGIFGFNTTIVRVPEQGHVVVLLNNTGGAPLGPMVNEILAILAQ